jgi:hypothetical protein
MGSKGILKNSGSGKPPTAPTSGPQVVFGRRTESGRFISYSRDDLDSEISSVDFQDYHVHLPMTPDNQPMEDGKADEQYVSSSLFTGGFNSVTRAHVMDKQGPETAMGRRGPKGSTCMVEGCDSKIMRNGRGEDILPCECDFKICVDCFTDAVKGNGGVCPGCKELYKYTDWEEVLSNSNNELTRALSLPQGPGGKMERRLSLVKQGTNQSGEFDHNRWLFETKGTYGYGNAIWPDDNVDDDAGNGMQGHPKELMAKPWRPLTRKLQIPAGVISPYRCHFILKTSVITVTCQSTVLCTG